MVSLASTQQLILSPPRGWYTPGQILIRLPGSVEIWAFSPTYSAPCPICPKLELQKKPDRCHYFFIPQTSSPPESPEQEAAMEDFLDSIKPSTGGTYRKISIQDDWSKTSPVDEKDLHQYLYNVSSSIHGCTRRVKCLTISFPS